VSARCSPLRVEYAFHFESPSLSSAKPNRGFLDLALLHHHRPIRLSMQSVQEEVVIPSRVDRLETPEWDVLLMAREQERSDVVVAPINAFDSEKALSSSFSSASINSGTEAP
jgi:hypothetical protein